MLFDIYLTHLLIDFTCVCILDAFKNDAASKAMERVLKLVSENRAKEIMKVIMRKGYF